MLTAQLNNLELHDSEINSLLIDFVNKKIEIGVATTGDKSLHISFLGVKNTEMAGFTIEDYGLVEIYSHTVDAEEEGCYRITFTLLLGFGKPCAFLQFSFQGCSLNGTMLTN
jgi:hypothetical protein